MRRNRFALVAALTVGLVVAGLVTVLATSPPATDRITRSPLVGRPAPPIEGQALDGSRFDIGRYEGQWVLVNFFASWCVPCRQEHPQLRVFAERHAATGEAQVVSVVFDDERGNVEQFFADEGGDWPVMLDDGGRVGLAYGVVGVPESYLVAPSGLVAAKITGGVTAAGLDRIIAELTEAAGGS